MGAFCRAIRNVNDCLRFCDLRGFTGFTESADAEDVTALLRDYHAATGEIIIKFNGTLERYAGDGVMVIFNDPVPVENPALQAVLMALEVRDAMGALMATWSRLGHEIGFGIGIAHGFATLGTIGFEGRFDYAAIGTVSNVASRLCDEAKPGQILISPRVFAIFRPRTHWEGDHFYLRSKFLALDQAYRLCLLASGRVRSICAGENARR
jgi:class 3 adenylate cyclase